jgi:septum site-determining protein MinC
MDANPEPTRQLVRLRGRSYVAFVFSPVVPVIEWLADIDATLARSPGFFVGKPVVLDLSALDLSTSAIAHLIVSLEKKNIRVLGIEGVEPALLTPTMPPPLSGGRVCAIREAEPEKPEVKPLTSLLLDQPVRSGQSIVFPEGDVTVLGSVGSGAEIVAGGSIHIYGTLRGRAMAGATGNARARIFCHRVEAELLAIDSYYKTAEDIDDSLRRGPAQAWLEGETLKISALN